MNSCRCCGSLAIIKINKDKYSCWNCFFSYKIKGEGEGENGTKRNMG
jgi:hypothetical protein